MTRVQVLAKALLTILGIDAVVMILRTLTGYMPWGWQTSLVVFVFALAFAAIVLIAVFLVFKNDRLATAISGPASSDDPPADGLFMVSVLRMSFVGYGLFLLCTYPRQLAELFVILLPPNIRDFISRIIEGSVSFKHVFNSQTLYLGTYALIFLLGLYFVCGAPHLVRFQMRQISKFSAEQQRNRGDYDD